MYKKTKSIHFLKIISLTQAFFWKNIKIFLSLTTYNLLYCFSLFLSGRPLKIKIGGNLFPLAVTASMTVTWFL